MDVKDPNSDRNRVHAQRDMEKLKRDIERTVLGSLDHILDIAEVAIGDAQRYKPFRAKVLRAGNDAIRDVKKQLDLNYKVVYIPNREDIVQPQAPVVIAKNN